MQKMIARTYHSNEFILEKLCYHEDVNICSIIANNPNITLRLLKILIKDKEKKL